MTTAAAAVPGEDTPELSSWKRLRHTIEVSAVAGVARVARMLPRGVVCALGRATGNLVWALLASDRKVAYANLALVFGDTLDARRRGQIARQAFQNLGSTMFGLFWGPRLNAENIGSFATMPESSRAVLDAVKASGRGVVFVAPHYSDWELLSQAIGFYGFPMMLVAEPLRNQALGELFMQMRGVAGHSSIPPRNAVLKLFRHLSRGGGIGMLVDVNGRRGRGGAYLDFFGLPVFSSTAPVELAMRTNAALLFLWAKPLGGGRIEVVVEPEVEHASTGDREADVKETAQRCLNRCEALIRANPDPWLWTYKRWKRRPTPELGRFPFYSKYDAKT